MRTKLHLIVLIALFVAVAAARAALHAETADGEKYSVSLNSPTTFPVDI